MKTPDNLRYTPTHEWVRVEPDGTATIGITDFAQDNLGDIVFVELPALGRRIAAGESIGVIESVKAAADLYAPIAGEVIATNASLVDQWERINQDAYAAWLYKLKPAALLEQAALLDAATYAATASTKK